MIHQWKDHYVILRPHMMFSTYVCNCLIKWGDFHLCSTHSCEICLQQPRPLLRMMLASAQNSPDQLDCFLYLHINFAVQVHWSTEVLSHVSEKKQWNFSCACYHHVSIAMKPDDISKELRHVFEQAQQLKKATERTSTSSFRIPSVTVSYLNTCTKWDVANIITLIFMYFRFSWMS